MKHIQHSLCAIFLLSIILCFTACEKMDDNGDLGGNWQLTSWQRLSDGAILATNADSIYYTFQGKLMKTQRMSQETFFLMTFSATGDSLILHDIYASPYDSIVSPSALSAYGVSPSGRFHFDKLSSSRLILSTETDRLTFRKY